MIVDDEPAVANMLIDFLSAQIGIDGFFNKPLNMNELLNKIQILRESHFT